MIHELDGQVEEDMITSLCYLYAVIHNRDFGFIPHPSGPYSPKVRNAIDELKGLGLLDTTTKVRGNKLLSRTISINTFSHEIIEKLSDWKEAEKIRDFIKEIKPFMHCNCNDLSSVFKILQKEGKQQKCNLRR